MMKYSFYFVPVVNVLILSDKINVFEAENKNKFIKSINVH